MGGMWRQIAHLLQRDLQVFRRPRNEHPGTRGALIIALECVYAAVVFYGDGPRGLAADIEHRAGSRKKKENAARGRGDLSDRNVAKAQVVAAKSSRCNIVQV